VIAWLRPSANVRRELEAAVIAVLVAVAIGSVLMLVVGKSPGHVWSQMVMHVFSESYWFGYMLYRATALALTGLAVAIALDAGMFNIGAEGQLTAGVVACAVIGTSLPEGTPALVAVPVCLLGAALAGGTVGAMIGYMRVARGAHEVITSIMLNAIVAGLALYLGNVALFQGGTTTGVTIAPGAQLPALGLAGSSANVALIISVLAIAGMWWLRARTTWGMAWLAVGRDPDAARSVGINVGRVRVLAMAGSGALAGLAAVNFVLGHKHAFEEGLGRGTGLLGISVALLGRTHPAGVGIAALLLGFLSAGGLSVAQEVPKELIEMLQGVVVLAVACAGPWVRRNAVKEAA
jgi:simple sugar transport system permease protein